MTLRYENFLIRSLNVRGDFPRRLKISQALLGDDHSPAEDFGLFEPQSYRLVLGLPADTEGIRQIADEVLRLNRNSP